MDCFVVFRTTYLFIHYYVWFIQSKIAPPDEFFGVVYLVGEKVVGVLLLYTSTPFSPSVCCLVNLTLKYCVLYKFQRLFHQTEVINWNQLMTRSINPLTTRNQKKIKHQSLFFKLNIPKGSFSRFFQYLKRFIHLFTHFFLSFLSL